MGLLLLAAAGVVGAVLGIRYWRSHDTLPLSSPATVTLENISS